MPTNGLKYNKNNKNLIKSNDFIGNNNKKNHNEKNVKKNLLEKSTKIEIKEKRTQWNIKASEFSLKTKNHIRYVVEGLKLEPNPEKYMIPLSIGDPTTFGNLKASDETIQAVQKTIEGGKYNGYSHSQGFVEAREAVVKYVAHQGDVTPDDIILCSGCSSSLDMCISALAESGQNILVPRPGFCLYKTLAEGLGIQIRFYDLLPERGWEINLKQMEQLIDNNTAAIILNNPSNPCGSVFSKKHLEDIIQIAENNFVPIIADEIYEHFVFKKIGSEHISVSSLSKNVPVLSCGGLTKRFLIPGWRMGWIVIHDRHDILKEAAKGLKNLTGRILGSNSLVQGALPAILQNTPQSYFDSVIDVLYNNAKIAFESLSEVRGLKPIMPSGAMYMMVGIDIDNFPEYSTDIQFVQELVAEQSVFCLPGTCFDYPNYIRIVLTVPEDMVREACIRMAEFCEKHYKIDQRIIQNGLLEEIKY